MKTALFLRVTNGTVRGNFGKLSELDFVTSYLVSSPFRTTNVRGNMSVLCSLNCSNRSKSVVRTLLHLFKDEKRIDHIDKKEESIDTRRDFHRFFHPASSRLRASSTLCCRNGLELERYPSLMVKLGFEFKPKNLRSCTKCRKGKH